MTLAEFTAIVAIIVPILVAFVANCSWTSAQKGTAALICSMLVGFATAYLSGAVTATSYGAAALMAFGAAQASYVAFWKPLKIASWVLEHAGNTQ